MDHYLKKTWMDLYFFDFEHLHEQNGGMDKKTEGPEKTK